METETLLFHAVNCCRMCRSADLVEILDLGMLALSGRFPGPGEDDAPRAPLVLLSCKACGLVQLAHNFDPDELYRSTYGYRSGINATMRNHLAGISEAAARRAALRSGDCVLDIGANDSTLLSTYPVSGLLQIAIDPALEQYREFYAPDVRCVSDFFSAAGFRSVCPSQKARVVTSIAMLYDLRDPVAFAREVASIMAPDGLWIFEQSDLGMMLEAGSFDTICHEHLEYYGYAQIARLVESAGLQLIDVAFNNMNGGSARFTACHRAANYSENVGAIAEAMRRDQRRGLDLESTYQAFSERSRNLRVKLASFLREQVSAGKTVHAYGASTKGNVLLQFCGIGKDLVSAAADRNPSKWGRRTPGTGIPIISEAESRSTRPDYYLVLPWHFCREFVEREQEYVQRGGRFIFPLPDFEIIP